MRKQRRRLKWLEERILELAGLFALDVCAFTILHNHHHLVLHINANKAHAWEADEVIEHWKICLRHLPSIKS